MPSDSFKYQEEKLKEIKDTLQGVLDGYREHPEQIVEMLAFKSHFYNYSMNNVALIYSQNPDATYVASFQDWKKKGYHVLRGQHGLKVLFPIRTELIQVGEKDGKKQYRRVADATPKEKRQIESGLLKPVAFTRFGIGTTFDIAQTDCPPEKYPSFFHMGYSSEQHAELYQAVKEYAGKKGFPVHEADLQSISLRGDFNTITKEIRISDKLNDTEKLSTLTHELGHAIMHSDPKARELHSSIREIEADCISIMLQHYVGLELTESRKRHLVDHYHACEGIKDFKLEDVLKDVNLAYYNLHQELEPILDRLVPEKEQETKVQEPEKIENTVPEQAEKSNDFILRGFDADENAYYAKFEYGGKEYRQIIAEQAGQLYVTTGAAVSHDLMRHDFTPEQTKECLDFEAATLLKKQDERAKLIAVVESCYLPDTLNKIQQAGLRRAVKHYLLVGAEDGKKQLEKFFTDWAAKEAPISAEIHDTMVEIYGQITKNFAKGKEIDSKVPQTEEVAAPQFDKKKPEQNAPYYHFYYENNYLFTVPGDKAQEVFDRLTSEARNLGYAWEDDGKAYRSDQKEAPLSNLSSADKTKTAYVPFSEKQCQQHIKYLEKIFAPEPPAPKPQRKAPSQDYREHDAAVLEKIKYGVSILTVAEDLGFTVQRIGSYYTLKEFPHSARIYPDTNSFASFSEQSENGKITGGSTIDFVMNYGGYNKQDAIRYLKDKYAGNIVDNPTPQPVREKAVKPPEKKEFKLPERADGKFARAFAYLTKTRCLDPEIVQQCFKSGMIYEDVKHNVVFVGMDSDGNAAYATRRSTLTKSNFKGDVAGGASGYWLLPWKSQCRKTVHL